jgi:hypothetical protein
VIVSLDSAARVAMASGGRGMLAMFREHLGVWLAVTIFAAAFLVNIVVNMSQMAAMVEGAYGAMGCAASGGGTGSSSSRSADDADGCRWRCSAATSASRRS